MRAFSTIAALLLAGCAATSIQNPLIAEGTRTTHWTDRAPADTATCIAANVERASPELFGVSVRRGVRARQVEMLITFKNSGADYAVVQIDPVAGGSAIRMWRGASDTEPDGGWPGRFMDGC